MPYDPHDLSPNVPTSVPWAIARARFFLGDTRAPEQYTQSEVLATLEAHAFTHETIVYYRPHVAAAALIMSDPDRATRERLLGSDIEMRDPIAIARSVRSANAWIDDLIESESEARPPSGRQLRAVF